MAAPMKNMARACIARILRIENYRTIVKNGRPMSTLTADSEPEDGTKQRISKAMKAYLARAKAHDEFIKQETHEFNVGKRHLANMMGSDPETFTQEDIDKSIQYLFPSGLFEPKARPIMRPPEEVFPKTKAAEFDESGRPHHYLFYTTRPNYSSLLHKCSDILEELDAYQDSMIRQQRKPDPEQALNMMGSVWLKKEALELTVLEKLVEVEFNKFILAMERIVSHPYGYRAAEFIRKYRVELMSERKQVPLAEPQIAEDGRRFVTVTDCKRKNSIGKVTVTMPGTGKLNINGQGIEYFSDDQCRHQVSCTLFLRS